MQCAFASRPAQAFLLPLIFTLSLLGCATPHSDTRSAPANDISARVRALLPVSIVLLGEQHDNPDHQRVHHAVTDALAAQHQLAAVVLEMAAQGHTTAGLNPSASEEDVQKALSWDDKAWTWANYAPAIMVAVRAGVPIVGTNLQRKQMREAMTNLSLDLRLDSAALGQQTDALRDGHCGLLPEAQIAPMTRVQIARDVAMASVLTAVAADAEAAGAGKPAKTIVFIAGSGHVNKMLGVPRHLAPSLSMAAIFLSEGENPPSAKTAANFDHIWPTLAGPDTNYCATFKTQKPG